MNAPRAHWPVALVAGATALAFLPALENGFVNRDDPANLLQNEAFRGFGAENLRWMFTTGLLGHFQPLAWLSFAADHALWGLEPFGYHLTALLLHTLNAALLYLVAHALTKDRLAAALGALLWALHPLRVESVAWATERRDLLHAAFLLLATWSYLKHAAGRPGAYALSLLAFAGALLSKVTAAAWPLALLALDQFPLRRRNFQDKLPYLALAALVLPLAFKAQLQAGAMPGLEKAGLGLRAAQALFSYGFYPWKTLAPFGLSPWYGLDYLSAHAWLLGLGVGVLGLPLWLWRSKRREAAPARAALLFYALTLFPMSGIVKSGGQAAADRYSYLPMMGLSLLAGAWLASRKHAAAKPAAAGLLLALGLLSAAQCKVWKDGVSFWERASAVSPDSSYAAVNVALALPERGRYAESLAMLRALLERHPDYPDRRLLLAISENNLGMRLFEQGKKEAGLAHLREAARQVPNADQLWVNLAGAALRAGYLKEGRQSLRRALALNPGNAQARALLGKAR